MVRAALRQPVAVKDRDRDKARGRDKLREHGSKDQAVPVVLVLAVPGAPVLVVPVALVLEIPGALVLVVLVALARVGPVALDQEVRAAVQASTSTTCSSDSQLFPSPMLRSATPSSFPVRRAWIRLV